MAYNVIWTTTSERELTELWLTSTERHLVTSAADQIDELLSRNPDDVGESRDENVRIVFVSPLAVEFEVADDQHTVYVYAVWTY